MGYKSVNGWRLWARGEEIQVTDPDNKIQTKFPLEAAGAAEEWARDHNEHVKEGHHSRGYAGGWHKKARKGVLPWD